MNIIAVLDYRIPVEIQKEIQSLATNKIDFSPERCLENERISRTGNADIVLISPWEKIDIAYLEACPNIKYIGLCGTSTGNIDLEELAKRNISFTNMKSGEPDVQAQSAGGKQATAEFFFMLLVQLARGTDEYQWKPGKILQLKNRTIGIIGLGEVGQGIARMALAYNMHVSYFSPHRKQEWEDRGVIYKEMDELLISSDIVVLCSPTNVKVLGKSEFEKIKQGSILIQACAGSPFNKSEFYDWVAQEGNFAIFDMSAGEHNYKLYKDLPRVIFSTHVAGDTYESNLARAKRATIHLKEYLKNN